MMACLNCTARVLRLFIHDSASPALAALRYNAPRRPLQRYPRRLAQFQQLRRESTYVTNHDQAYAASDDEYIPFDTTSLSASLLSDVPFESESRPPPPPPAPDRNSNAEPIMSSEEGGEGRKDAVVGEKDGEEGDIPHSLVVNEANPVALPDRLSKNMLRKAKRYGAPLPEVIPSPPVPPVPERPAKKRASPKTTGKPATQKSDRKPERISADAQQLTPTERNQRERKPHLEESDEMVARTEERADKKMEKKRAEKKSTRATGEWELPPIEDLTPSVETSKLQRFVATTPHRDIEGWRIQKAALERKFGVQKWNPQKRLSPEALDGIRLLHAQHPHEYPTEKLAELFEVSAEAIRRILKSKWRPAAAEVEDRNARWERRGQAIWQRKIEDGTIKTKAMKKREQKERAIQGRWNSKVRTGPDMSSRFL